VIQQLFYLFNFLAIFFVCTSAFSEQAGPFVLATTEGEPGFLIGGVVDPISGSCCTSQEDLRVEGVVPIILSRTFIQGRWGIEGGWQIFPHLILHYEPRYYEDERTCIVVYEPNGSRLCFTCEPPSLIGPFTPALDEEWGGVTNTAHGVISARTNLKNYEIIFGYKRVTLKLPSNGERIYVLKKNHGDGKAEYHLQEERLPNGNYYKYVYDGKRRLIEILATNPAQTKTYSWVKFHYSDKLNHCDIETSDGQNLHYRFTKPKYDRYLDDVYGSSTSKRHFDYDNQNLTRLSSESGNYLEFSYYKYKDNDLDDMHFRLERNDPRIGRIKCITAPVGENNGKLNLYRFVYRTKGKKIDQKLRNITDVFDPYHNRTTYFYDEHGHPTKVEYFEQHPGGEALVAEQRFSYGSGQPFGKGELCCKSWIDKVTGNSVARTFSYDKRGNVLEERFWGNLTGRSPAGLALDDNNLPIANGCESYAKRYTYDEKDRVIRCEEDNGCKTTFAYLHNTDLTQTSLIWSQGKICKREFSFYNDDHNLICLIEDDGCNPQKDDLTGLTERRIRRLELREQMPALGLPAIIREYYLDLSNNKEILLSKKVLHYSVHSKVCREDLYTDEDNLAFSHQVTFDSQKRIIEKKNPLGQTTGYNYTPDGFKTREVSPGGRQIQEFQYDLAGRLTRKKLTAFDNLEQTLHNSYNALGALVAATDSHGHTAHLQPSCRSGKPLQVTLPPDCDGKTAVLASSYDSKGRPIASTDAEGHTTKVSYNALGQIICTDYPDGTSEQKSYTLDGLIKETVDQEDVRTAFDYDSLGRKIAARSLDKEGILLAEERYTYSAFHPLTYTDPAGNTTRYTYDFAGRKISEQAALETKYAYDALGRLIKTEQGETVVSNQYDLLDRLIEEKTEDSAGHLLSHKKLIYDDAGNVVETQVWDGKWIVQEATLYDGLNRVLQKTDACGRVQHFTYDDHYQNPQGQEVNQIIATDPLGIRAVQTFDTLGHVVKEEILSAFGKQLACTENRYDGNGRKIAETSTVIAPSSARRVTTLRTWDSRGRLIQLAEAEGTSLQRITRYTYTAKGLLENTFKPDGVVLTSLYDPLGRCMRQYASDKSIDYTYCYNAHNLVIEVEDAVTASRSARSYDTWGRLVREELATGLILSATHDPLGRRTSLTLPDDSGILYTYDSARLNAVHRTDAQGNTLYSHRYLQCSSRNLLAKEGFIYGLGEQNYSYDNNGRLIGAESSYLLNKITSFDAAGKVTGTLIDRTEKHFAYDELGHLSSESGHGKGHGKGSADHTYSYDSLHNRRTKDSESCAIDDLNQLLSCSDRNYEHDPNGNPLCKTNDDDETQYRYDALGRLIAIEKKNSWRIRYAYDAWHRRLQAIISTYSWGAWHENPQEFYIWDGNCEIGSCNAEGIITELRILGNGFGAEVASAVAIELDGHAYAPLHDTFGNVQKLISYWGFTFESYTYTAFGEEPSDNYRNPWRFASKRHDKFTGLIYFGRRYYSPQEGRWLTPDPAGLDQGANLYAFVRGNPLNYLDLFGLSETPFGGSFEDVWNTPYAYLDIDKIDRASGLQMFQCNGYLGWGRADFFISSCHWDRLQFTPEEMQAGRINIFDHIHELVSQEGGSISLATQGNGIMNTLAEFVKNCADTAEDLGGILHIGLYNPTYGLFSDAKRNKAEQRGEMTLSVYQMCRFLAVCSDRLKQANPDALWLHIPHSENGVITKRALERLPEHQEHFQKSLLIFAVGPSEPIAMNQAFQALNVYSNSDGITKRYSIPFKDDPNYDIRYLPCKSSIGEKNLYFADHGFLAPTYRDARKEHIKNLKDKFGFYDPSKK